jgi:hypothetical protein
MQAEQPGQEAMPRSRMSRPAHLLAAAAIFGLLAMPVSFAAQESPHAAKAAGTKKQIKKLKHQVAGLNARLKAVESKPDQVGQVPASLPPSGPAGGGLAGTYPNPLIAADSIGASQVADGSLGTSELSGSIPAARVTNSADQTIGTSGVTALAFDTARYDTANLYAPASNTRLTAPVDGIYVISASVQWAPTAAGGLRSLTLQRNAAAFLAADTRDDVASTTSSTSQDVTTQARLNAGDFIRAQVFQDSGGDLSVKASPEISPELSMTWLAPG